MTTRPDDPNLNDFVRWELYRRRLVDRLGRPFPTDPGQQDDASGD
ncbi:MULTISPECIES: hypothetical protein [Rhodococcus]|nr:MULTISPECIES: hypothetical protein [Rhodococcus]MDV7244461.1 hypothetical protein [Rhodococcus oxybenzonivorans]MDV7274296.1 hypothetical protein [Rhodococcus oxybenzonivorans]MDV7337818.1 hypothetical protein [Rhodococcus oxybenzonivorans]MDV7345246.1 hypothetical protein [Rhodococcus oxybenzonivorans]MDV8028934.1 hypothetical protein [Rhodococcus sp. IEGM 27]